MEQNCLSFGVPLGEKRRANPPPPHSPLPSIYAPMRLFSPHSAMCRRCASTVSICNRSLLTRLDYSSRSCEPTVVALLHGPCVLFPPFPSHSTSRLSCARWWILRHNTAIPVCARQSPRRLARNRRIVRCRPSVGRYPHMEY